MAAPKSMAKPRTSAMADTLQLRFTFVHIPKEQIGGATPGSPERTFVAFGSLDITLGGPKACDYGDASGPSEHSLKFSRSASAIGIPRVGTAASGGGVPVTSWAEVEGQILVNGGAPIFVMELPIHT